MISIFVLRIKNNSLFVWLYQLYHVTLHHRTTTTTFIDMLKSPTPRVNGPGVDNKGDKSPRVGQPAKTLGMFPGDQFNFNT